MTTIAVIPARYASSRFPGKPLVEILGVPMIVRVARITAQSVGADNTWVATDDDRIASVVESAGFRVARTHSGHLTGTDRLCEVATQIPADIYLNVQGDEPMLDPDWLQTVIDAKVANPNAIVNAMSRLGDDEDPDDINIPKVVTASDGRLLYMSRAAVPSAKSPTKRPTTYMKQVCIYAFNQAELATYASPPRKAPCEVHEDIEILRFLDRGCSVKMVEVSGGSLAVDNPEDVPRVEAAMRLAGLS